MVNHNYAYGINFYKAHNWGYIQTNLLITLKFDVKIYGDVFSGKVKISFWKSNKTVGTFSHEVKVTDAETSTQSKVNLLKSMSSRGHFFIIII